MARPDQEAIETFMSIAGVSEAAAVKKLEEHHGNLNEAVNAHFGEGNRNLPQEASFTAPRDDVMDIDDPMPVEFRRLPSSLPPITRDLNPLSLLGGPNFTRSIFGTDIPTRSPFISHPREVREIPIEVKDDGDGASGHAPFIEEVTGTGQDLGPEIHGTVISDDEDEQNGVNAPVTGFTRPSAPTVVDVPDDIEEEMIRAAIEASKKESTMENQQYDDHIDLREPLPLPRQSHLEDDELAHAVSLSLQTAEQEKALRELKGKVGTSELEAQKSAVMKELGKSTSSNGRKSHFEFGGSSVRDESEDVEDPPLVRHRRRRVSSASVETNKSIEEVKVSPPSSPRQQHDDNVHRPGRTGSDFPSDEWGGISSEEHDEAVMLEAAMFGGIHYPSYAPTQPNGLDRGMGPFIPRSPSPTLTAQRLIREQQDDEYLASLQADREKELKAQEESEAALAEERRKEEEVRKKSQEEEELSRQLAVKESSLPAEPTPDHENAVTLLVRMPDGSRRGRRFMKSDKLQYLFDFIDVGKGVKPGTYRLVRPYPRRAFSSVESSSSLNELGLTSKQEALYLELI